MIDVSRVSYAVRGRTPILAELSFHLGSGEFLAVLGENGAGKTTLLDLVMGFRAPTTGTVKVLGATPSADPWETRRQIAYLSEKVDMPGDWSVGEFLEFNRAFYPGYSLEREGALLQRFGVRASERIGNLSAGEIRRAQVAAALAAGPRLVVVDEVTAVLDIIGRRRFMETLSEYRRSFGCAVIMATNILEDLESHATQLLLLARGETRKLGPLSEFTPSGPKQSFSQRVADVLEGRP